jgi:hypothetical protein
MEPKANSSIFHLSCAPEDKSGVLVIEPAGSLKGLSNRASRFSFLAGQFCLR